MILVSVAGAVPWAPKHGGSGGRARGSPPRISIMSVQASTSVTLRAVPRQQDSVRLRWATPALAAVLAAAGVIHGALMPEHLAESTISGAGFLGAAVGQIGLAGLVLLRPPRIVYAGIVAMTLTLIALYAFNVMVGLPFHGAAEQAGHAATSHHSHHAGGWVLGSGEPVDLAGAVTQVAQLAAIGLSVLLIRDRRSFAPRLALSSRFPFLWR